ncbi:MAG: three-Cys-motif partner protein TcmP, partial [Ktedonobacterales bacterium]
VPSKLAYKVGRWNEAINYVDGFAGPWRANAQNLSDTSPHIAIRELRAARDGLSSAGQSAPSIRCFFVEKAPDSCQRLQESVANIQDVQICVRQGEFEQHIQDALDFASEVSKSFTFFFIDPTGWTGFGMHAIAPVLRHTPGEILINFMTKDIKRFIDDPTSVALPAFEELFGSRDYRANWQGLAGQDREDEIV